jgi:hypothetical protein
VFVAIACQRLTAPDERLTGPIESSVSRVRGGPGVNLAQRFLP